MANQLDDKFYDRADAHIHLSNDQLGSASRELVNASMLFASARFSAWLSAGGFASGEAMAAKRDETLEYFVAGFRVVSRQIVEGFEGGFVAEAFEAGSIVGVDDAVDEGVALGVGVEAVLALVAD